MQWRIAMGLFRKIAGAGLFIAGCWSAAVVEPLVLGAGIATILAGVGVLLYVSGKEAKEV